MRTRASALPGAGTGAAISPGRARRVSKVLERHPDHPAAALLLGTIEAEAGRDAEAARWLNVARAGGADPVAVNYQLAQVLRTLGQTAEADAALRRFTERRAAHWAVESATRAADREPKNAELQCEVGRCFVALGEPEVAVSWFVQALKIDPNHRASHAALADYYARQPDPGAATRAQFHRDRSK